MFKDCFLEVFSMFFSIGLHLSFFLFLILSDKTLTFEFAVEHVAGIRNIEPNLIPLNDQKK